MTYVVVISANGKSYQLAKQRIGTKGEYSVIATFLCEGMAKKTAEILNKED
jgi:hypothetical protein